MVQFYGISIKAEEIELFLKNRLELRKICHDLLGEKVMEKVARERNIIVNPEEIQAESEQIRHEKKLEKVTDTLNWLENNMLTSDEWEISLKKGLLSKKLAHDLLDKEIEYYFNQNKLDFEEFVIYQIVVPYKKLAQEIFYQIEEEEISFYEAAHLYDIDQKRRRMCGYLGKMNRGSFQPDVAAAIFKDPLPLRQVLGPIQTEQGFNLFIVEEYIEAKLTSQRHQEILEQLFKNWLDNEINYAIHSKQGLEANKL